MLLLYETKVNIKQAKLAKNRFFVTTNGLLIQQSDTSLSALPSVALA
jgi:hypothetical protein